MEKAVIVHCTLPNAVEEKLYARLVSQKTSNVQLLYILLYLARLEQAKIVQTLYNSTCRCRRVEPRIVQVLYSVLLTFSFISSCTLVNIHVTLIIYVFCLLIFFNLYEAVNSCYYNIGANTICRRFRFVIVFSLPLF